MRRTRMRRVTERKGDQERGRMLRRMRRLDRRVGERE